ncbi:MurT ligase domain-containing protein [Zongyangia hominis]|uniref:Lipid II isoglutaminyl synthase (glutamine-hydrolyzing) subunit MurT n=1 Tax=Zongyangia hominis TaxID=2763677 RepID=A0A926EF73_9FIRM|nr:MurT ligase domain-containing protein [Zongyangia hominis]MBC8571059.1 DUF1727 domain-containing protein [Zongyangia hominis]
MKFKLALLVGKILYFFGKFVGKSSNLPGDIALKICPDMLGRFQIKGKIIAVTGSNGKTTTANMVAHVLQQCGHTVTNNAKGSNMTGGVATTLLNAADFSGVVPQEYVVLEVDERFSRIIFKSFSPHYMLVTNLFRDQLTRNGNVDVIIDKLHEAIGPEVKLVLNANDPISSRLALQNERVYYGLCESEASTKECQSITHDAKVCPVCFHRLRYDYFHYNHIGGYHCDACGYENPQMKYVSRIENLSEGAFVIDDHPVKTGYNSLFNILNMTACVAVCCEAGIPEEEACKAVSSFQVSKERYDEFQVGERKAVMILSKNQNPVSFDQSISQVLSMEGEKTVVIYVNNINHTGHRDTTWLYDIAFERLKGKIENLVCTGPRAYDLAVRLNMADFDMQKVKVQPFRSRLKATVDETKGTICVLTELYDAKGILEVISR